MNVVRSRSRRSASRATRVKTTDQGDYSVLKSTKFVKNALTVGALRQTVRSIPKACLQLDDLFQLINLGHSNRALAQ